MNPLVSDGRFRQAPSTSPRWLQGGTRIRADSGRLLECSAARQTVGERLPQADC
jgi:hypothetical protein